MPIQSARQVPPCGLVVTGVSHRYGRRQVVADVALSIGKGDVHCLVGPSGCGKTTILRLVAGLLRLQAGRVEVGGRQVAEPGRELPPEARRVGLMFQDFALFPHLRVGENIAFGLQNWSRPDRDQRVLELLGRVRMDKHVHAYPHMLSGGEQQRVALARAVAPRPQLVLLDEAFSALDATLRHSIRTETLGVLRGEGTATLLVTHDPEEAIHAGEVLYVMEAGRIVQSGTPAALYATPKSPFVASFFGAVSRFTGTVRGGALDLPIGRVAASGLGEAARVEVVVRPEAIQLLPAGRSEAAAAVIDCRDLGPIQLLTLGLADGSTLQVRRPPDIRHVPGERVEIDLDPSHVFVYPASA